MSRCQSRLNNCGRAVLAAALLTLALTVLPGAAYADELVEDEQLVVVEDEQQEVTVEEVQATTPEETVVEQPVVAEQQPAAEPVVDDTTTVDEATTAAEPASDVDEGEPAPEEDTADEPAEAPGDLEVSEPEEAVVEEGEAEVTAKAVVLGAPLRGPSGPIEDGYYTIETAVANNQVVVANGGNTSNSTNVLTYAYGSAAIKTWYFQFDSSRSSSGKSVYAIYVPDTNQVLAVSGSSTNVLLWENLNSDGQRWILTGSHTTGWKLTSYKDQSTVLDVTGSGTGNNTNVAVAQESSSRATRQRFYLLPLKAAAGSKVIENGVYEVNAAAASSYVMAVGSSSTAAGASAILYTSTKSAGQKWQFTYDDDGYYTIIAICSGKALAIPNADHIPGADARQYQITNSDAQKWAIYDNGSYYTIVNKNTGLYLAISGGNMANSTNVLGWRPTGANSQKWIMTPVDYIEEGIYEIKPIANDSLNLEFASATGTANARLGKDTNALNQRYEVKKVGSNQYTIRTGASGGYLGNTGSSIDQSGTSDATAEVWEAFWNGNYFSLRNTLTGKVIDLNSSAASGVSTKASTESAATTQHFRFVPARLIEDGIYTIRSQVGTTLAVASGSVNNNANIVSWAVLNSPAQKFVIQRYGAGYLIYNAQSGMAVAPVGSSECDVRQRNLTSVTNQVWIPEISNGGYVTFRNAATGEMLAVGNSNPGSNSNVVMWGVTHSQGQNWKPVAVTYTGWCHRNNGKGGTYHWSYISDNPIARFDNDIDSKGNSLGHYDVLYRLWYRVNGYKSGSMKPYASNTRYLIVSGWDDCYLAIFEGVGNSGTAGYWRPLFGWNCGNGNKNVINQDAQNQAAEEGRTTTWSWDPEWDYLLALGNDSASAKAKLPDNNAWARQLTSTNYKLPYIPNNRMERYFTSVRLTLGYHTTITSHPENEVGRHTSHGCIRLEVENAKWIYDNIKAGTRCIQLSSAKGSY